MVPDPPDTVPPNAELDAAMDEEEPGAVDDALDLLFSGRVEALLPEEELGEFYEFIREEALRRRRFAVSFRLECRCLAWIGYALSNVITHEDGIEFTARAMQSYVPDHEPDVDHPEGATEEPPDEFAELPIWPLEIYQDELDDEDAPRVQSENDGGVGGDAEDLAPSQARQTAASGDDHNENDEH